jgi:peptidoglycan L-alanyl-D-glutamate endopeptidase CwlK
MEEFKLSKSSKKNIKGINKDLNELVIRVLKKSPHDFGIPKYGGVRTPQEQNNLYHTRVNGKRVTQLDGFNKLSYHQSANAVDIFVYDEHKACWDCVHKYKEIADLMKEEFVMMKDEGKFEDFTDLQWGGDWIRFKDLPHFQIT